MSRLWLLLACVGCATAARVEESCRLVRVADSRGPFARYGAAAASDGRYVYVAAGSGIIGEHGRVDRFDPSTGSWSVLVDELASRRYVAAAVHGRRLFVIGGSDQKGDVGLVEAVDLDRRTVEKMPPLDPPRRAASAVVHRDRIWVIGGAIGKERTARTDVFDPKERYWSRGPDLAHPREARAIVAKGTIWVLGGYAGEDRPHVRSIERLEEDRFVLAGEMPAEMSAFSAEVVGDRWVYTFGDYDDLDRVMRLDLETFAWTAIDPGYTPRRHTASARVGETLIVFGGNVKSSGSALDLLESFEERCGQPPAERREKHRRLHTVQIASESLVRQMIGVKAGTTIPVLERPDHFFSTDPRSRLPKGLDQNEQYGLITVWRELNLLAAGSPIPLGTYDPTAREILLSAKGAAPEHVHRTLSHEMVHALRHAHGSYDRLFALDPHEIDGWLAERALIEGDATLFGGIASLAQEQGASPSLLAQLLEQVPNLPESFLDEAEQLLRRRVDYRVMPYQQGLLFVAHVLKAGGPEAVARAFTDPPRSTEQILHPEKYLGTRDEPQRVNVEAPPGWKATWSGSLGEFDLLHSLSKAIGVDRAERAAAGWGGGRIALFESSEGSLLRSTTVWDTEADAMEFAAAWSEASKKKGRAAEVKRRGAWVEVTERLEASAASR